MSEKLSYKDSGVDRTLLEQIKEYIKRKTRKQHRDIIRRFNKFGSIVSISWISENTVMVVSVDGVGTKLKLIAACDKYETAGFDLVNHLVNDIAALNARPSYFLDYISFSKLKREKLKRIIDGIILACEENNIELIGGETAQMPGYYGEGEFELVGAIIGFCDRNKIIDGKSIKDGDILIGLQSSGLHTNGYSLARKALFEKGKLSLDYMLNDKPLSAYLLAPHKSYLNQTLELTEKFDIHSIIHITGGGLYGNIQEALPKELDFELYTKSIPQNPIFDLIKRVGNISSKEMFRTFNMGVGIVYVLSECDAEKVERFLEEKGELPIKLGRITRRSLERKNR